MDINTNFIAGKMNKSVDERLVPVGQYIDALNVRLGSTENTEIGAVENSKGNTILTNISHESVTLSANAKCIGAFEDGVKENIYWFVHDPTNPMSATTKVDMILSYNTNNQATTYHVISESVLNFNPQYLITGVDLLDNLLFFTDDFNPPRKINITRNYPEPNVAGDQITAEELNVIVKPPGFSSYTTSLGVTEYELAAPLLALSNVAGEENYLKDKFICFAYRYQYKDNEYSATSLFTRPAFQPGLFSFEFGNYYNAGMENSFNSVDLTFNTGSDLVIAIELLFKESAKNTINVIERFDKSDLGWSDNELQTFRFTNSKIYTVLGSDELLRLYDNVPRFAKAQTIMGNRLIYGNYVEQYNIETADGQQIPIDYEVFPVSDRIVNSAVFPDTRFGLQRGAFNYINPAIPLGDPAGFVPLSSARFVFTEAEVPLPIKKYSQVNINLTITSTAAYAIGVEGFKQISGDSLNADFPTTFKTNTLGSPLIITTTVIARNTYSTFSAFLNSVELAEAVGTGTPGASGSTITPITTPPDEYGFSLSDQFYSRITPPAGFDFVTAGLWTATSTQDGFRQSIITTNITDDTLVLQIPSVHYLSNTGTGTKVYEFFGYTYTELVSLTNPVRGKTTDSSLRIRNSEDFFSLHSNRNYEAGIMYMDDFGRATTVLVSPNNTAFFPASTSIDLNTITAHIFNKPPHWATKYKFLLKPSLLDYDIIYSNSIFTDQLNASISWVRLEGYAGSIVNKGDILTVKIQSNGTIVNTFVETTVLDVEAKSRGGSTGEDNLPDGAPAGLYMKIQPRNFIASTAVGAIVDTGFIENTVSSLLCNPLIRIPLTETDALGNVSNIDIPAGAAIEMTFRGWRSRSWYGTKSVNIETTPYRYEVIAAAAATDFKDFWDQEGLNPSSFMRSDGEKEIEAIYYPTINASPPTTDDKIQFWYEQQFPGNPTSTLFLVVRLTVCSTSIGYDQRPAHVEGHIIINKNNNLMAFETKPAIADADLYYDSSEMYNILPDVNGDLAHMGDNSGIGQNQVISTNTPAKVTLPFADCYAFGNGIESFRYRDLPTTNFFRIGERVSAVNNSLFREEDRFAGLTYSGVFSDPSNINNLNEFNLGLVNFKDCEVVFGPIMKLHARQTDILVLQEDRISYVLANKNLISDSTGGGAIVSVPEILGQQITRIEEYGISFNPESFTSWGRDMYFSDTKRGAIIKLTGAGLESDTLEVISTYGMRSYFRNKFSDQLTTQKLGGYDPYMDEYVFSTNNTPIPMATETIECGARIEKRNTTVPLSITVDVTSATGNFDVIINPSSGTMDVNVVVVWDGNTTTNNNITSNTVITINKNTSFPKTATITVTPNAESSYNLFARCVETQTLNVVRVVLGSPISGLIGTGAQTIHYEYNWSNGQITSPTQSNQVTFSGTDNVSAYSIATGQSSLGLFPPNGATITMRSNKIPPDTFVFSDTENRFYVIPDNNLPASSGATFNLALLNTPLGPIVGSNPDSNNVDQIYTATSSAVTIGANTKTLYLVWDFRDRRNEDMCYSTIDATDACIGCNPTSNCTEFSASDVQGLFVDACNGGAGIPMRPANYFHNGTGTFPVAGDKVWRTSGPNPSVPCDQGIIAQAGYYYLPTGDIMFIQSNSSGIVVSILSCP